MRATPQAGDLASAMNDLSLRVSVVEETLSGVKEVMTLEEACFYLGFSKSQIYKLTRAKAIPFHKPGGKCIFFSRTEINLWAVNRLPGKDMK